MATNYTSALKLMSAMQALDAEQLGYVDTILRGARLSQLIPIVPPSNFMQDTYYEKKQAGTSTVQGRRLNQNPDTLMTNKYDKKYESTILVGGRAEVDYKILKKKPNELDRRVSDGLSDLGQWLDYKIINGDPDGNNGTEFAGLKYRLTGNQLVNSSSLTIATDASTMRTFMSYFRTAKRRIKVSPGMQIVAVMNETIYENILKGRDLLGADFLGTPNTSLLDEQLQTLDGVPLMIVRTDDIGTDILPMTESSSTSSIYLIGLGGSPSPDSLDIPNGVVALSADGVQMTPEIEGNIRRVTYDYEYGLRVPSKSSCRIQLLK